MSALKNATRRGMKNLIARTIIAAIIAVCSIGPSIAQTPVSLAPVPRLQFFSPSGAPLASGCVSTFLAGTSTPAATYVDSAGVFQNSNPIILDVGGFATIYLANQSYRIQVNGAPSSGSCTPTNLGQLIYTQDNVSSYQQLSQLSALTLVCANSDPAGVAGEIACRSDLGKLRFFFSIWDSVVTENSTATLVNKTLTSPAINSPTIATPILNGTPTGTSLQGTDTKLLTSGTVSGTGVALCTDANGGATTSGCAPQLPNVVFNTASAQFTATTALIPMVTPSANATYRFSGVLDQTIAGASCAGNSTYQLNLSWTDQNGAGVTSDSLVWSKAGAAAGIQTIITNGAPGNINGSPNPYTIRAKSGASIGYAIVVTPGGSCAPAPTVQFYPVLEQVSVN